MKLGGACLNQTPIDWSNNRENILSVLIEARRQKIDLLCLPELCLTGYGCEDLFKSPWIAKKALHILYELLPYTQGIMTTIGLPVRFKGLLYNCVAVVHNEKIVGFYAKQKLAKEGVHYEPRWFAEWPSHVLASIEINGNEYPFGHLLVEFQDKKIAFEICEDAWQEDSRPASCIQEPADIILNPSASHFAWKKSAFRERLVTISSQKFDCLYLYTNLLGNEAGRMIYDGDILIAYKGKLIGRNKRLSFKNYNLLSIDSDTRSTHVQDDFSSENEAFTQAAALALFDYKRKSQSNGFVLSLSGGADSGTIATLVAELVRRGSAELGNKMFAKKAHISEFKDSKEAVHQLLITAYQGSQNSSKATFESAQILAKSIGAQFYSWKVDEQIEQYTQTVERAIGRNLNWKIDDLTLQNIQARSRSPIIWMLANINNSLLLATSNRSEGDVGYATMDGDTSGSISPIAGVSKQFILQWLKFAEQELGYKGLSAVNRLQPTAELRPNDKHQTDEDDLMPYLVLAKIERKSIYESKSPKEIFEEMKHEYDPSLLKKWIKKYHTLWGRNQWKRERYAPSFHFDDFNIDPRSWYRFPILSGGFREELESLE